MKLESILSNLSEGQKEHFADLIKGEKISAVENAKLAEFARIHERREKGELTDQEFIDELDRIDEKAFKLLSKLDEQRELMENTEA